MITNNLLNIKIKDSKQYVYYTKSNVAKINHNYFARLLVEDLGLQGSDGNILMYQTEGNNNGLWLPLSKIEVDQLIVSAMEIVLGIDDVKPHDLNHISKFLVTHAESKRLKDKLESRRQSGELIFLKDCVVEVDGRVVRDYKMKDYALAKLPYGKEDISVETPKQWLTFLDNILDGWEDRHSIIDWLQEYIGWCFVPSTKHELGLIMYVL